VGLKKDKRIQHGVNAYKQKICRCEECTKANTAYEKTSRNKNYSRPSFNQDTLTLEEYRKFRAEA